MRLAIIAVIFISVTFSIALANDISIMEKITKNVKDVCQSPDSKSKYWDVSVKGGGASNKILKLIGIGVSAEATFSKKEWDGVQKVLKTDQASENVNYRECVAKLTPLFVDKFIPSNKSELNKRINLSHKGKGLDKNEHTSVISVKGSNNTVVQGINNTVITKLSPISNNFASIKVHDILLSTNKSNGHNVHYMAISGMEAVDIQAKTNHLLKRIFLSIYEKCANWDEVDITYKVGFTEFNLLGMNINIMTYNRGAAHPLTTTLALVVNLENAELFELKDLFRSGFKEKINNVIVAKLKQAEAFYPCKKFAIDKEHRVASSAIEAYLESALNHDFNICFSGVNDNGQFYLTDTSIIFVFPQYSIAPGVHGDIEVPVNYQELQGTFNPNGPLRRFL